MKTTVGEIFLAPNGVLFLDELPQFKRSFLETMRQPLEELCVTISGAAGTMTFPFQFMCWRLSILRISALTLSSCLVWADRRFFFSGLSSFGAVAHKLLYRRGINGFCKIDL